MARSSYELIEECFHTDRVVTNSFIQKHSKTIETEAFPVLIPFINVRDYPLFLDGVQTTPEYIGFNNGRKNSYSEHIGDNSFFLAKCSREIVDCKAIHMVYRIVSTNNPLYRYDAGYDARNKLQIYKWKANGDTYYVSKYFIIDKNKGIIMMLYKNIMLLSNICIGSENPIIKSIASNFTKAIKCAYGDVAEIIFVNRNKMNSKTTEFKYCDSENMSDLLNSKLHGFANVSLFS